MDGHLVNIHWLLEAFGGPEYETLTVNQQMAPQYLPILKKGEIWHYGRQYNVSARI